MAINMAYIKSGASAPNVLFLISLSVRKHLQPCQFLKSSLSLTRHRQCCHGVILRFHSKAGTDFQIIVELGNREKMRMSKQKFQTAYY